MMMKVIKTEEQYQECLAEAERLIDLDPIDGTPEADRLELLTLLINTYEDEYYCISLPSAIEGIKFRMEQQGLRQRDLVPFIGNKSKVSEVLSGKRVLTVEMIRALSKNLGIPLEVLLQENVDEGSKYIIEWEKFPIKEMNKRGWIDYSRKIDLVKAKDLVTSFLKPTRNDLPMEAFCRRTLHERAGRELDKYSLFVWIGAVLMKAREMTMAVKFDKKNITNDFLKEITRLSRFKDGPLRARKCLAGNGIALVVEPHLPKTKLDGCTIFSESGMAVIGLTIRYDRLDNFWHTLFHELAHIVLHVNNAESIFVDNLDVNVDDNYEKKADELASDILIPRAEWICSPAKREQTPETILELAGRLKIHAAIIAGRIRNEANNYTMLNQLVGHGEVRKFFPDVDWQ